MKEDSFENQWKDVFENASHTPPPDIWNRVEAELDKKKKSGFLIWKNPFLFSGVAAAVLFVLGTVFLFEHTARTESITKKQEVNEKESTVLDSKVNTETVEEVGRNLTTTAAKSREERQSSEIKPITSVVASNHILGKVAENRKMVSGSASRDFSADRLSTVNTFSTRDEAGINDVSNTNSNETASKFSPNHVSFDRLELSPMIHFSNSFQKPLQRIDLALLEEKIDVKKEKGGWFGVVASNAPFNPNFSTPGLQQQAASAIMNSDNTFYQSGKGSIGGSPGESPVTGSYTNTNRRDAESNFKIGSAISYGLGFGKKIRKKLAIESGVRFTTARNTHVYNVYSVDKLSGSSNSFPFENYVQPGDSKNSDVLISVNGSSQITYNFLSIPVLLNYNLINLGRFNVNAVGGLSSEILLSGNVAYPKDVNQSFNAGNSNFKAFNIAGLGGVRLSYALTKQLDVNLGSTYQHFLNSGIESSSSASFRPSMLGLNMGISMRR